MTIEEGSAVLDSFFLNGGFEILFTIVFLLVLGVFVAVLIQSVTQWNRNNLSPRLTVSAVVAAKRLEVHHAGADGGMASTCYYITFEVKSGDRMELSVSGREYGLLAEGDTGSLTFQGTRYLSFERSGMATTI